MTQLHLIIPRLGALALTLCAAACSPAARDPQPASALTAVAASDNLVVANGKIRVGVPNFACGDAQITACDIERIYLRVLGRKADRAGLNNWLAAARAEAARYVFTPASRAGDDINSGLDFAWRGLATSSEARTTVSQLFRVLLKRPGTQAEIDNALYRLNNGSDLYELTLVHIISGPLGGDPAKTQDAFSRLEQVPVGRL